MLNLSSTNGLCCYRSRHHWLDLARQPVWPCWPMFVSDLHGWQGIFCLRFSVQFFTPRFVSFCSAWPFCHTRKTGRSMRKLFISIHQDGGLAETSSPMGTTLRLLSTLGAIAKHMTSQGAFAQAHGSARRSEAKR